MEKLFSELKALETELMDTWKDHIRLVNFGFEGKVEKITSHLRLVFCTVGNHNSHWEVCTSLLDDHYQAQNSHISLICFSSFV